MVATVMTLAELTQTTLLRARDTVPIGQYDNRTLSFHCAFSEDAINWRESPAPTKTHARIRVTVRTDASPGDVDVEIYPPDGGPPHQLDTAPRLQSIPWARPLIYDDADTSIITGTAPRPTPRLAAKLSDWQFEDPFPDWRLIEGAPPQLAPPGGGGWGGGNGGGGGSPVGQLTYEWPLDPRVDRAGTWRVRVSNKGWQDAQFTISVQFPETVQILHTTRIPFQLINHTFKQAMLALGLRIKLDSGQARISFNEAFKTLTGIDDLHVDIHEAINDINLQEYNVAISNDQGHPVILAGLELEEIGNELEYGVHVDITNMSVCVTIALDFAFAQHDFFLTAMKRINGEIKRDGLGIYSFVQARPELVQWWAEALNWGLDQFGVAAFRERIEAALTRIENALRGVLGSTSMSWYFYDVLMHLAERGHVMYRLSSDDESLIVQHHAKPDPTNLRNILSNDHVAAETLNLRSAFQAHDAEAAPAEAAPVEAAPAEAAASVQTPTRGQVLTVTSDHSYSSQGHGKIDHIVFLMLENRSFDHMLGYRGLADNGVRGLRGNESNVLAPAIPPYVSYHREETAGIRCPDHGFEATLEQIAGGQMSGFVKNYAKRPGVVDPRPVMSYYTGNELLMYEFLANNYAICDNWHSSHPGETQCNRFCAIMGQTPELTNLALSDPRLAYVKGETVFEHLTENNIDWVYAEGNVAFLRMFDRYRLDVDHIIPFRDHLFQGIQDTFERRVKNGRLPSVSFIDPRYIDVPPHWDANDDLPPADVCRGQELVRDVYRLLSEVSTWQSTLLVITYDEHGGFYDHAPPAGMALSSDPTPFPRVHPQGVDHLGVRVPAFVVSPWIDQGTVLHEVFDHTSILKTILNRFIPGFPIEKVFGPRTASARDLATVLTRSTQRQDEPAAPGIQCENFAGPQGPGFDLAGDDFHTSMRLLGVPRRYRERVVVV